MKPSVPRLFGIGALVALIATLLLSIFAWPVVQTAPNRLPVGLVAPATLAQRLPTLLESARPGAFAVRVYPSEDAARAAIRRREVYGALSVNPAQPAELRVLTASAAGPMVAQVLTGVGGQIAGLLSSAGFGVPQVEDVVPATADDPRQAALVGIALPLVLGGILSGLLLTRAVRSSGARLGGAALTSLLSGVSLGLLMQFGFKTLQGDVLLNGLSISLGVGAVVFLGVGLVSSLGVRGLSLMGIVLILLSNPFSGLSSAPELLPGGWGTFGQGLPLGAFGQLLRSVAFFEGHGSGGPLLVLLGWVSFGAALIWVGSRQPRTVRSSVAVAAA